MKNFVVIYGSVAGFILGIFACISMSLTSGDSDLTTSENIGNIVMLIVFLGLMFHGIKTFRDRMNNGAISYGQVFTKGLLITLMAGVIYSLIWVVYTSFSDIDFNRIYMEMTIKEMEEAGASDKDIALTIQYIEDFAPYYENPVIKFLITILEPLFPGVISALILGFVLKRKEEYPTTE